jgi:hypothetical protein
MYLPDGYGQQTDISSRQFLIQSIQGALNRLDDPSSPAVITLCSSRGGGKTALLEAIRTESVKDRSVHLLGIWDAAQSQNDDMIQSILAASESAPSDIPRLALIDNFDALLLSGDGSAFFDVERELVLGLVERGDTLLVLTSRAELLQWAEGDVMYRQENRWIPPFSPDELITVLEDSGLDTSQVYGATLGHPQMVAQMNIHPGWSGDEVAEYAYAYFLEGFPDELRVLAAAASLMPAFNVLNLRMVLGKDNDASDDLLAKHYEQIHQLQRQGIVQWSLDVGAYRFTNSVVRRLLARRSRFQSSQSIDSFERYKAIQLKLAAFFQEEARSAAYLYQHLVSAVYHLAQAHCDSGQTAAAEACLQWVDSNQPAWFSAPWQRVLDAWENGAGEPAVRDEIIQAIGIEGYERITRQLEQYQRLMEV